MHPRSHLQPPIAFTTVRIERGSPLHATPEKFGLTDVRPAEAGLHTYPLTPDQLTRLSIYFDHKYVDGRDLNQPIESPHDLERQFNEWVMTVNPSPLWQSWLAVIPSPNLLVSVIS